MKIFLQRKFPDLRYTRCVYTTSSHCLSLSLSPLSLVGIHLPHLHGGSKVSRRPPGTLGGRPQQRQWWGGQGNFIVIVRGEGRCRGEGRYQTAAGFVCSPSTSVRGGWAGALPTAGQDHGWYYQCKYTRHLRCLCSVRLASSQSISQLHTAFNLEKLGMGLGMRLKHDNIGENVYIHVCDTWILLSTREMK